ncbi:hypothetical protein HQ45_00670 [Porphyromonas crevioricanis]|uniref:ComE operon protein 1 n=2 Tax=Porphyromonas crevioricanis TaxID=393921 RepID=A0A0A2FTM7_9PORP|nr:helix-hairpin-helix domain-containing protein [Porphyromonas crevioricanis]KGN91319.1 hypothetical protein HQ45_00670 [Porphyromonas crevioricanis]KGN94343.1 hypothetical protein HQ38_05965 [Porphyromonas crevioricanis]SJZ98738.1 competence protein ComEA helix-hairpin-helix repeat region [Porphyromonas crevioricanis]SQH72943.1 ComE operon protein 1 [Porphyromonas crevioricanis]GAD04816.1 conserved hypothetical protein; possible DNA uptake-related protein [Porphyromonas crevioricanis JCM 159
MRNWLHIGKSELIVLCVVSVSILLLVLLIEVFPAGRADNPSPTETALPLADSTENTQAKRLPQTTRDTSIERSADYAGPPEHILYKPKKKLTAGSRVDLNTADSATLTTVPGIGPAFARRIVAYRKRLGGFYTVLQLQEVYGMDHERYSQIKPYFSIGRLPEKIALQQPSGDSLPRHPYLNYKQKNRLEQLIRRNGCVQSWQQLYDCGLFNRDDSIRLSHYFTLSISSKDSVTP